MVRFYMKKITQEWLNKADADFKTATREAAVIEEPNWDAVCYHAQQVRKIFKSHANTD